MNYKKHPCLSHSKEFMKTTMRRDNKNILKLTRPQVKSITEALTEHCLRKHLNRLGLTDEFRCCWKCGEPEETPLHIMCQCVALMGNLW